MLFRLAAFMAIFILLPVAQAAERKSLCVDASVPKEAIIAHGGKWIELTNSQWQFMRGIYAMNPETPAGFPFGDKAVLAQVAGNTGGLVFFIDGDKACEPMPVPRELVSMLADVAMDVIHHEGGNL